MTLTRIPEGAIPVLQDGYRARTAISGKLFAAELPRTETGVLAPARATRLAWRRSAGIEAIGNLDSPSANTRMYSSWPISIDRAIALSPSPALSPARDIERE